MGKNRPIHLTVISVIIFIIGLMMIFYWTKYIINQMPLKDIPIASETIAAILSLATGIGLFLMKQWSFITGILLSGFWMYGCISGINIVIYDLIVYKQLQFKSPIGALTDAILFFIITMYSIFIVIYLWNIRKHLLSD